MAYPTSSVGKLEQRLADQLAKDRMHTSRCRPDPSDPGTIIVTPSGTSCGLAYAIAGFTGEDEDAVMNRVVANDPRMAQEAPVISPESLQAPDRGTQVPNPPSAVQGASQVPQTGPSSMTWSFTMTGTITLSPLN